MEEETKEIVAEEKPNPVLRAIKINNPLWIGNIAAMIQKYVDILKVPSITYETLYTYFVNIAQYGGDNSEFWVVFSDDEPIAFGCWFVRGLPHRGATFFDHIYSWNRMSDPVGLLCDEYIKFSDRHNCPIYEGVAINEVVWKVHKRNADKKNVNIEKTGQVFFQGRKRRN